MKPIIHKLNSHADWYQEVCQQLDALKRESIEYADQGDILPPGELFNFVKERLNDLRQLADFPALGTPDVWLGPDGQIGLTWDAVGQNFDLIFRASKLTARLTVGQKETLIAPKDVPSILSKFAA